MGRKLGAAKEFKYRLPKLIWYELHDNDLIKWNQIRISSVGCT